MKREKTKTTAERVSILFIALMLLIHMLWISLPHDVPKNVAGIRYALQKNGRIVHAGGFLNRSDGILVSYTNSLEALENCYRSGNRFCEIDLQETFDGLLICGHGDEEELAFGTGLLPTASGEDFLNSKIYGEFTPLSADGLTEFMRKHPDFYVITDVKTDNLRTCRHLAETYPDLRDRLIVQIQLPEEYDELKALGFPYIMYPIFKTPDEQRGIVQLAVFARHHDLVALILPNGYYSPDAKLLLADRVVGTPFVLHTLNDDKEISYYLENHLALAVYTDRTDGCVESG